MATAHRSITGADLHIPGYKQSADPGAVGAGKWWHDTDDDTIKVRNAADSGWITIYPQGAATASSVSIVDAANDFTATNVEDALAELQADAEADATALADHLADTADAHDASAISILDSAGDFTATDVEGALAELQSDNESHVVSQIHIARGTSFPPTPSNGDIYLRTDLDLLCFYDGTRWLTQTLYSEVFGPVTSVSIPLTATTTNVDSWIPWGGDYDVWVEGFKFSGFIGSGTALSGSHKWVGTVENRPSNATVGTINLASGASNTWRAVSTTVGALMGTSEFALRTTWTKTGTPGNLTPLVRILYRLVIT